MKNNKKYGFKNSHIEYHTINPKKEKPANCIFLNNQRDCTNKISPMYGRKCFVASCCSYRIKETKQTGNETLTKKSYEVSKKAPMFVCGLTVGTKIHHKTFGIGTFDKFVDGKIYVSFDDRQRIFKYPDLFKDGRVYADSKLMDIVRNDINELERYNK